MTTPTKHRPIIILPGGARLLRFACVGGTAALLQLAMLHILTANEWNPILADGIAFLLAAQVNFLLSSTFTWGDRTAPHGTDASVLRRWITFHGSITSTALLNLAVFTLAHPYMPTLLASACGIAAAACVNYITFDRVVFRTRPVPVRGQ